VVYPLDRTGAAAVAARDPSGAVFPTWAGSGGGGGAGVVIGFLDTGINDAPDGAFPGHESLLGRCLGGASFVGGDSTADTPPDGQDVASRLASRAVELGIVVVASVGNDGHTAHVPSPGAGGGVITVGALDDHGTPGSGDDAVAAFGNRGPRATDGDGDPSDE